MVCIYLGNSLFPEAVFYRSSQKMKFAFGKMVLFLRYSFMHLMDGTIFHTRKTLWIQTKNEANLRYIFRQFQNFNSSYQCGV